MYTCDKQEPVDNFEKIQCAQGIRPAALEGVVVEKVHQRKRIECADVVVAGVGLYEQKPKDLQDFRDQENKLSGQDNPPALAVRNAIAKHEATDPDDESNDGKLPGVYQRNGEVLQSVDNPQNRSFGTVLQKLESGSFVLNERDLDEQKGERAQAEENEQEFFVSCE